MSNFDIFRHDKLESLIKPFASEMTAHITPIKYEAITPDIFALLFRTTSPDGTSHFFVSLEFDYVESIDAAIEIIEKWHGPVIEAWPLEDSSDEPHYRAELGEIYSAILTRVERPTGHSYWASNVIVANESEIEPAIVDLTLKQQKVVRKGLKSIFAKYPSASISFYISEDGTVDFVYK